VSTERDIDVERSESRAAKRSRLALAGLMTAAGITHFVAPASYERTVPRWFGDARRVVLVSGAAEIACGALLSARRTGRIGGALTAALLAAVFPANVQMALDAGTEHQAVPGMPVGRFRLVALGRLPLQLPLIGWAVSVARGR
jgi:uncharacterized membrane protein